MNRVHKRNTHSRYLGIGICSGMARSVALRCAESRIWKLPVNPVGKIPSTPQEKILHQRCFSTGAEMRMLLKSTESSANAIWHVHCGNDNAGDLTQVGEEVKTMKSSWKQLSAASLLMAGLFVAGCTEKESDESLFGMRGKPGSEGERRDERGGGIAPYSPPLQQPAQPEESKQGSMQRENQPGRG